MSSIELKVNELMKGSIDIHMHTGPDIFTRSVNDIEAAQQAKDAGLRAILIKNHLFPTPERAFVASEIADFNVFGSISLNYPVGGLNVHAVETSIKLGAKEVWMPTFHSTRFISDAMTIPAMAKELPKGIKGISILDSNGKLLPEVFEILDVIAKNDVILGTGHVSKSEGMKLLDVVGSTGIKKIFLTHPMIEFLDYKVDEMKTAVDKGALLEHDWIICTPQAKNPTPPSKIADVIKEIGAEFCILASDGGQKINPPPVKMFEQFVIEMLRNGISEDDISVMISENPAKMLGL
ncbi:MAG: DUF6282 family protein [Candidatus Bathyarchaeota archaeon]|nr:DUF6282 family protein [Candidatus Bathyarchaeota archaeon]